MGRSRRKRAPCHAGGRTPRTLADLQLTEPPVHHSTAMHAAMAALGSLGPLVKTAKEKGFAADGKTPLIEVTDVFAAAAEGDKLACDIIGGCLERRHVSLLPQHPSCARPLLRLIPLASCESRKPARAPATAECRPPTTDHRPPTTDRQPPTADRRPPTADRRPPLEETARCLAIQCINLCRNFDPHMILFGGGMADAGEALMEPIRRNFQELRWKVLGVSLGSSPLTTCGRWHQTLGIAGERPLATGHSPPTTDH